MGKIAGRSASMNELDGIFGRQVKICKPVAKPSCEDSCGAGYVVCASWPNCYNPGMGQICCSDGEYCDAGTYCTDTTCCKNGMSLAECNAKVSLSVYAPPATTSEASSSSSSSKASSSSSVSAAPPKATNGTVTSVAPKPPTATSTAEAPAATFTGGDVVSHSVALPFCLVGALVAGLFAL